MRNSNSAEQMSASRQKPTHRTPEKTPVSGVRLIPSQAPVNSPSELHMIEGRHDRRTPVLLAILFCIPVLHAAFALTPSSYGIVLGLIQSENTGTIIGQPRPIRSDEWAVWTPYFQACVRNALQRFNKTSFYEEDLRSINGLPLKDWGLLFKPQHLAFLFLPPANALGAYYGVLLFAFLAGYHLLFQEIGITFHYALGGSLLLFLSAFTQFWWTTLAPCLALFPWVALVSLKRWPLIAKVPLLTYTVVCWLMALVYPPIILPSVLGIGLLLIVFRKDLIISFVNVVAISVAMAVGATITYLYFVDLVPVLANTVYPGNRLTLPGMVSLWVIFSQVWPFLTFTISDYTNLINGNLCENGVLGSYLMLLTIVLLDYSALRKSWRAEAYMPVRRALTIFVPVVLLVNFWMAGPCPVIIGRILLWDRVPAQRLLFLSGFLLLICALLLWQSRLLVFNWFRLTSFILLGPLTSVFVKSWVLGETRGLAGWSFVVGIAVAGSLITFIPSKRRFEWLFGASIAINAVVFIRFNPLQSAKPIFNIPETRIIRDLKDSQQRTPGGYLVAAGFPGAVLNGLGFRSVAHVLIAPRLEVFRQHFPYMDAGEFNAIFNRFAHIQLANDPVPISPQADVIRVPWRVFEPPRNVRHVVIERGSPRQCSEPAGGAFDKIISDGKDLTVVGWAPWIGEGSEQRLRIRSTRSIVPKSLLTLERPDVSEVFRNYNMNKAGFRLVLTAQDGKPVTLDDVAILADGTASRSNVLHGCDVRP